VDIIMQWLDLHQPMQSVPFTTKVSLISTRGKVCTILGQCLDFSGYSGFLQLEPKINVIDMLLNVAFNINKPNITFIMECLDLWEWILNIRFNSFSFSSWVRQDQLTCVIVSVLTSSVVDYLFKVYISCIHCFNAKHASWMNKSKVWLSKSLHSMSEWSDKSVFWMLF